MTTQPVDPSKIMQVGLGFWASKTLLAAIELELFTLLGDTMVPVEEIQDKLGLHERGVYDFLDSLVSLGFLEREGMREFAVYGNAEDARLYLDKHKPEYMGGMLELANRHLYPSWSHLEEGLKTGMPQNGSRERELLLTADSQADEEQLREFINAMAGLQIESFELFATQFDFSEYHTHCDLGGAGGHLSCLIALHNEHMHSATYDLPQVGSIARDYVRRMGLEDRVKVMTGDFFKDPLPRTDLVTMGNVLHNWDLEKKKELIARAYHSLHEGGALVIIENIIDEDRCQNLFGLLMSLNMLIETSGGFDYTASEFSEWAGEAGFREVGQMPLAGPASALVAFR